MKSPKDMKILQIDITNACVNRCSNCTRFCGHHRKPYFMDFETFKKAVDSYDGWDGMVGIIGGEPTLHPEFEKFCDYLREKRECCPPALAREPIDDMQDFIMQNDMTNPDTKIGLWCSLNNGYYRYFETINDTFYRQYLNDHNNECLHQAILMTRKELGISDEEFIKRRDNCFAQNTWSATITPKGAFFCEIAAHLDMLFNGPGGWPIEKGWYNRSPEEFGEQLQWCEMCGLCLDVPKRVSCDERDDVTPLMLEKLKEINSPKVAKGMYVVLDPSKYDKNNYKSFEGPADYIIAGGNIRTTKENRNYYPRKFEITSADNLINCIKTHNPSDWIVITKNKKHGEKIAQQMKDFVLNPGCLYKINDSLLFNVLARSIRDYIKNPDCLNTDNIVGYYPCDKVIEVNLPNAVNKFFSVKKDKNRIRINVLGLKISVKRRNHG